MTKLQPPGTEVDMKEKLESSSSSTSLSWNEKFSRSVVKNPCKHYLGSWGVVLLMSVVAVMSGWFEAAVFTSDDWADPSSRASRDLDAYFSARDNSDTSQFFESQGVDFRTQNAFFVSSYMIYEWSDESREDDILTAENLQAICEFERLIFGHPEFPRFCVTQSAQGLDTECSFLGLPFLSSAFYNFSMQEMLKCDLLEETLVETIKSELVDSQGGLFFFDVAIETDAEANSPKARSFLPLGGPLGPDSTDGKQSFLVPMQEEEDDSYVFYRDFFVDVVEIIDEELGLQDSLLTSGYFKKAFLGEKNQMRVRFWSTVWDEREFIQTFGSESYIIMLAIVGVGILMYYHMRNLAVVLLGIMGNMFSVPAALFLYRGIFQVDYFTSMHIITFFLIIGIGADNIFVFFDSWKQSKLLWKNATGKEDSVVDSKDAAALNRYGTYDQSTDGTQEVLIYRLKYTISVASTSILNTMSTTFVAFIATAFNPLSPIAGFGIFAAIVVMCNYLFVFMFLAPLMIIYENTFQYFTCCCGLFNLLKSKISSANKSNEAGEDAPTETSNLETIMFEKYYVPIMLRCFPWLQIILVLGNLVFFAVMISEATKLELPDKPEEFYKDGHMYTNFFEIYSTGFAGGAADDFDTAVCTFGIEGVDRDGFDRLDPAGFRGEAVFDDEFDLASSANQLHFLSICEGLRALDCTPTGSSQPLKGCLGPDPNLIVFPGTLTCILEDFYEFMEASGALTKQDLLLLGDEDPVEFYEHLQNFSNFENHADVLGFYDDQLTFAAISFTTASSPIRPTLEKSPIYDLLNEFLDNKAEEGPEGLEPIGLAGRGLVYVSGQETLVAGLFQGLSISIPFAYLVLLYGTNNIILATFALISIGGIIVALLGTVQVMGSSLGYVETISAIMVVGLSVDYTIHIGHMYDIAGSEGFLKRNERFEEAARRMGPTVFAGYLTTAVSAATMQFCQLTVFPAMGILILLTVTYSLEVALFFYLPLCLLLGPENDSGKISHFLYKLKDRALGKDRETNTEKL